MPSYAHLTLIGHVGRDPEMRYLPSGSPLTTFSVGVTVGYGERKATLWVDVTCFGKLAEVVNQYVTKGMAVLVAGEPGTLAYESEGEKRYRKSLPVTAQQVRFLSRKGELPPSADDEVGPDDIPFN